jgi:hypothetical protein
MLFCGLTGMPVTLLSAKIDNVLRKSICLKNFCVKPFFWECAPRWLERKLFEPGRWANVFLFTHHFVYSMHTYFKYLIYNPIFD